MDNGTKQSIDLVLSLLKTTMKECNLVFGIMVDKTDFNKSQIAFLDRESLKYGKQDGVMVSLDELNK